MDRHLLITVSEGGTTPHGVRFVGNFFSSKKEIKVTIFYTAPRPAAVWLGERTLEIEAQREKQIEEYEAKGREALEAAAGELIRLGFSEDQVLTKLQVRRFSKALDIIQEGEDGLYDAVVLGRRGLSWLEQAFDESVSKDVLDLKFTVPVWVCRRPDPERRNVLLCLDGSGAAYRVADHVAFMLGQEPKHRVTLLVIKKAGKTTTGDMEAIFEAGKAHLTKNGLPEDRIETRMIEGGRVRTRILETAQEGLYAAVAVGRTGAGQGLMQRILMGSVSTALFRDLERTALWFCY